MTACVPSCATLYVGGEKISDRKIRDDSLTESVRLEAGYDKQPALEKEKKKKQGAR